MYLNVGKSVLEIEQKNKTDPHYGAEHYPHSISVISTTLFMLNKFLYKGTTYKLLNISLVGLQNTCHDISLLVRGSTVCDVTFLNSDVKQ